MFYRQDMGKVATQLGIPYLLGRQPLVSQGKWQSPKNYSSQGKGMKGSICSKFLYNIHMVGNDFLLLNNYYSIK